MLADILLMKDKFLYKILLLKRLAWIMVTKWTVFLERLGKSAVSIWDHELDNAEDGFRRREGFLRTKRVNSF